MASKTKETLTRLVIDVAIFIDGVIDFAVYSNVTVIALA